MNVLRVVVTTMVLTSAAVGVLGCTTGTAANLAVAPNVKLGDGYAVRLRIMPTFADYPPADLLRSWDNEYGFKATLGIKLCGTPFIARSQTDPSKVVYGRLVVFGAHPSGRGAAGRGSYIFAPSESTMAATSGGRMSYQYESYLTDDGQERYAWIAYVSDRPVPCTCTNGDDDDCKRQYPEAAAAGAGDGVGQPVARNAAACGASNAVFGSCRYARKSTFTCSEFGMTMPNAQSMVSLCARGNGTFVPGEPCPTTLTCCGAATGDGKNCLDESVDPIFAEMAKNGCTKGGGSWCPAQ